MNILICITPSRTVGKMPQSKTPKTHLAATQEQVPQELYQAYMSEEDNRLDYTVHEPYMSAAETAHYVSQLSAELSHMARAANLDLLAYFLDMARVEASTHIQLDDIQEC
jgi:hypothetical protein